MMVQISHLPHGESDEISKPEKIAEKHFVYKIKRRVEFMLDDRTRFLANDELALLNAISMSELTKKKLELYKGLAKDDEVRKFFEKRAILMKKVSDDFRKHLERIGGA